MVRKKKTRKAHHGAGSMFYREGRGKPWVVQITVDGKLHCSYFTTEDEAKEYRAEAAYKTKYEGMRPPDRRTTVHDCAVLWLATKTGITPNVRVTYAGHIERYLKDSRLGRMKLADVEPSHIRAFVKELMDAGKAASYVQHIMTPISQAFSQADEDDTIPRNPCARVKLPTPKRDVGKALTDEEVRRLLAVVRVDRHAARLYPLFVLAFSTGARIGELLALKWSVVDWEAGTLRVEASLKREAKKEQAQGKPKTRLAIGTPKTHAAYRTVALKPEVLALLRQHRARQNEIRLQAGTNWQHNDLLFCTYPDRNGTDPGGKPLEHSNVRRTWNRLLEHAGLDHYRVYDIRHTVFTMLAEADVNPDKVRLLAGHEDVRTTLSYYTHTTHQMTRDAVAKLPTYHVHVENEPELGENEPKLDQKLAR